MPRLCLRWIPGLVLAVQALVLIPAGVLAEIRADRCCEDRCPEHRSAMAKAECCGVDVSVTAEAAVPRVTSDALPACFPSFVVFFATESGREASPRCLFESPGKGVGPPIFLALRSLRI